MARRRKKNKISTKTMIGVATTVGAIGVFGQTLQNLPNGFDRVLSITVSVALVIIVTYPVLWIICRIYNKRILFRKIAMAVEQQSTPLMRRRAQLVRLDAYGKPQTDKWIKEIEYFISQHIRPSLTKCEQSALGRNYEDVVEFIRTRVEIALGNQPEAQAFPGDMTSGEFENYCAQELRRKGWDARVTMQSRDQGVDVVAEKAGRRVVIQCKLYSGPVGNKSVQEATAARAFEQADVGIVVSNSRYTSAAEQLAASNRILLLHYRDLQNLDEILGR